MQSSLAESEGNSVKLVGQIYKGKFPKLVFFQYVWGARATGSPFCLSTSRQ